MSAQQPLLPAAAGPGREADLLKRLDRSSPSTRSGSRRLQVALAREGLAVGRRRIRRLMKKLGLWAIAPNPTPAGPTPSNGHPTCCAAWSSTGRTRWATDITYLPMQKDSVPGCHPRWATRRVLAWRLSNTLTADFCAQRLKEAIAKHGPPEIFNTDQGSQFTSEEFTGIPKAHAIRSAWTAAGAATTTSSSSGLWWTVKHEWVYLRPAANGIEQKRSLIEFFDWYNRRRPHQSLGWQTPDEAYFSQPPNPRRRRPERCTVDFVDSRLRRFPPCAPRNPVDGPWKTRCVSHRLPIGSAAAHKLHSAPANPYKIRDSQTITQPPALAYSTPVAVQMTGTTAATTFVHIDPRNLEEFYYGKGKGSRRFAPLVRRFRFRQDRPHSRYRSRRVAPDHSHGRRRSYRTGSTSHRNNTNLEAWPWPHEQSGRPLCVTFRPHNTFTANCRASIIRTELLLPTSERGHIATGMIAVASASSAGQGPQWRDQILDLAEGDVVVAYEGKGYVGVGKVKVRAVPYLDFPHEGRLLHDFKLIALTWENPTTPLILEYVLRIEWVACSPSY